MSSSRRVAVLLFALSSGATAGAQTDYYNTDAGRPVTVEDAYPVERRAFELQLAPLRLERARGGIYTWGVEPEVAFGLLPRTHVEVGFPIAVVDAGSAGRTSGLAGVDVSLLHNLNVETSIPALAVVADLLLPAGGLGPDRTYLSMKGIATKTFTWARFHVNGKYTFGEAPAPASASVAEVSRWMGGVAIDRTLPLRSLLITAEAVAHQPFDASEPLEWISGTGLRYQLSPRWAVDGGVGYEFSGARPWYVTFGSAYAFGLPWHPRR